MNYCLLSMCKEDNAAALTTSSLLLLEIPTYFNIYVSHSNYCHVQIIFIMCMCYYRETPTLS